jgi:diguanylate cyclase (GGDEF)-like protein
MSFGDSVLSATLSIGIAALHECGDLGTSEGLLLLADERLYQAKQTGRNRVCAEG